MGGVADTFILRSGLARYVPCKDKRVGSACHLACSANGRCVLRGVGEDVFAGPIRLVRGIDNIAT